MGRYGASREQAVYELERRFENGDRNLCDQLARGRLGFLEFQRARADLERHHLQNLERVLGPSPLV
jgi:hypothetical protein